MAAFLETRKDLLFWMKHFLDNTYPLKLIDINDLINHNLINQRLQWTDEQII